MKKSQILIFCYQQSYMFYLCYQYTWLAYEWQSTDYDWLWHNVAMGNTARRVLDHREKIDPNIEDWPKPEAQWVNSAKNTAKL